MTTFSSMTSFPLPQLVLTAQSAGHPQPIQIGLNLVNGWVKVWNESPFQLQASDGAGAWMHEISAQVIDVFPLDPGVKFFTLLPIGLIPFAAPTYKVRIAVFPDGPPPGSYPQALGRQSTPVASTGNVGFTLFFNTGSSASGQSSVSVFNPANNTHNFVFSAARVSTTMPAGSSPSALVWLTVANPGFANPLTPVPHFGGGPASTANCGWQTASAFSPPGGSAYEVDNLFAGIPLDFFAFPDQKTIAPGFGVLLQVDGAIAGFNSTQALKWTEQ